MVLAVLLSACAGGAGPGEPAPSRTEGIADPMEVYRQLGLISGSADYPAVASFATLAGPQDSTYVLFALSLPNTALRFQRADDDFLARYTVHLTFRQDSQEVRTVERREVVRVDRFAETGRTDESVIFQELVSLPPGDYVVEVDARDELSGRGFRARDTLAVPAYAASGERTAPPLFVYQAAGRSTAGARLDAILNPRHTIYYGTATPRLYLEGYGVPRGHAVSVRVVDEDGEERWQTRVRLEDGTEEVRYAMVDIPAGSLPVGKLWLEVLGEDGTEVAHRTPLLVTISDQWLANNFEEVLEFMEFIATSEELDSLKNSTGAERQRRWDAFWARRDPVPATPMNEYREQFFQRIRLATAYFSETGLPGWKTDRGEVFIVLGRPDYALEQRISRNTVTGRPEAIQWVYENAPGGRLELLFIDRNGFGRYELTPSSESAFRTAARRLKRDAARR